MVVHFLKMLVINKKLITFYKHYHKLITFTDVIITHIVDKKRKIQ